MNNPTPRSKQFLTVTICLGLVVLAVVIFATAAQGAARFITTPIGFAPPEPAPVLRWVVTPVDMGVVKALRAPRPAPARVAPRPVAAPTGDVWGRLRNCESSDGRSSANGLYHNWFQFDLQTWHSAGGKGHPRDASYAEALAAAKRLQAARGWGPWPSCSRQLGLR